MCFNNSSLFSLMDYRFALPAHLVSSPSSLSVVIASPLHIFFSRLDRPSAHVYRLRSPLCIHSSIFSIVYYLVSFLSPLVYLRSSLSHPSARPPPIIPRFALLSSLVPMSGPLSLRSALSQVPPSLYSRLSCRFSRVSSLVPRFSSLLYVMYVLSCLPSLI